MSNKKILSNTVALYFRLLITLFVSLFTTRIVLKNLGVEDYGLYGTVAGIIALIAFLQNALSGATNRFFNVEMVKDDIKHIQKLFTTSFFLHICIAIFICLALEIVGVIGLKYYIHIPDAKLTLANNVLHLSIISLLILILTIPFEALLIAKENFKAYAFISIFETFAKLAVACSLVFFTSERLVYYAFGLLLSTLLVRSMYVLVTKHLYQEVSIRLDIDKGFIKQIFSFVSWDLYGNFAFVVKIHGTTLILNNFFGLIVVASIQIGYQVLAALSSFSSNFILAVKPQLMQSYAEKNYKRMNELTIYSSKYSYYLMLLICVPIIMNIDYLLKTWLVNTPQFAKPVTILILISCLIGSAFMSLNYLIKATGKIKTFSILTGSIYLTSVFISFLLFKFGFEYYTALLIDIVVSIFTGFFNILITHRLIKDFDLIRFCRVVLVNTMFVTTLTTLSMLTIIYVLNWHAKDFLSFLTISLLTGFITLFLIYTLGIEKSHRKIIQSYGWNHIRKLSKCN